MKPSVMQVLKETGVIAIVRGISSHDMLSLADALFAGGVRLMEVTMNTEDVIESIASLSQAFGDKMCIGAGTVLSKTDAQTARDAGATFLVTPHVEKDVTAYGVAHQLPVFGGAMTPTEIFTAYQYGAAAVKVFPSRGLGPGYFKDVRGPFPEIPLLAVGGVSLDNATEFLEAGAIGWGLGGGLVNPKLVAKGNFEPIESEAAAFVDIYRKYFG